MLKYINILLLILFAFTASAQKVNQIKPCKDATGAVVQGCFVVTDPTGTPRWATCEGDCDGDDYVLEYTDVKTGVVLETKTLAGICADDGDLTLGSVTFPNGNTTQYSLIHTNSDGTQNPSVIVQDTYSYPSVATEDGIDANGVVYFAGDNLIVTPSGIVCIPSKDAGSDIEIVRGLNEVGDTLVTFLIDGAAIETICQPKKLVPTESRVVSTAPNPTTGVNQNTITNTKDGAPIPAAACTDGECAMLCFRMIEPEEGTDFVHECIIGVIGQPFSTYTSDMYATGDPKSILSHVVAIDIPSDCSTSTWQLDKEGFAEANNYNYRAFEENITQLTPLYIRTQAKQIKIETTTGGTACGNPSPNCALSDNFDNFDLICRMEGMISGAGSATNNLQSVVSNTSEFILVDVENPWNQNYDTGVTDSSTISITGDLLPIAAPVQSGTNYIVGMETGEVGNIYCNTTYHEKENGLYGETQWSTIYHNPSDNIRAGVRSAQSRMRNNCNPTEYTIFRGFSFTGIPQGDEVFVDGFASVEYNGVVTDSYNYPVLDKTGSGGAILNGGWTTFTYMGIGYYTYIATVYADLDNNGVEDCPTLTNTVIHEANYMY